MTAPHVLIDTPSPGVRLVRLNRQERRNALDTATLLALAGALVSADADLDIGVVVLTGGDEVFAAGADIQELRAKGSAAALSDARIGAWSTLRAVRKPIIGAVEGWCLGAGNELLLCCDVAIASRDARFGQPETNLGIMPGAGGAVQLSRVVGRALAMKMLLTGKPISSDEARACGLVAEITEPGAATERALALARELAARAPLALQQAKAVVRAAFDAEHAHFAMERQAFSLLLATEDKREGIEAFLERRAPVWKGQ